MFQNILHPPRRSRGHDVAAIAVLSVAMSAQLVGTSWLLDEVGAKPAARPRVYRAPEGAAPARGKVLVCVEAEDEG